MSSTPSTQNSGILPSGETGNTPIIPEGGYTKYVAILNQAGAAAPVATILENNISSQSGDIVWTRNSTGNFSANATDGFPVGKTWVQYLQNNFPYFSTQIVQLTSVSEIRIINQYVDARGSDDGYIDGMINSMIEIRVYN